MPTNQGDKTMKRTAMSEVKLMIAEARDSIETTCTCSVDGADSCQTCHAVALLYKSLEVLDEN